MIMQTELIDLKRWLSEFADAVREKDFAHGRELFDDNVVAFGTFAESIRGLDELVERQWAVIWKNTDGFRFDLDDFTGEISGSVAWAAARWHSTGIHKDGRTFPRSGRATFVLSRHGDMWKAVHSHHSIDPGQERSAFK